MKYIVIELYLYPIKSLAGIRVVNAKAEEMGFENDRRWMLIDEENQFITQRKYPILSQFYPKIKGDKIEIGYQDLNHKFYIEENLSELIFSNVWDDECKVFEVNKTTSKWFSDALGFTCKLVKISNKGDRIHRTKKLDKTLNVSLADGYPYLLIGSKSLDLLNEKLDEKITIERFRPNILIDSHIAHEEDFFDRFQIGNVKFQNVKPCGRCVMVNNNPKTGVMLKEPLKTLSTYRKLDNSVLFGTNIMCLNEGVIAVGDFLTF
ncbi:MOSC domain-containing protein [Flavobacterium soyangense]|nr:MOSC N-terminal beta barrel domain-containing protein [Flavobacterium soyangense]